MYRRRPAEHWNGALADAGRLRVAGRGQGAGAGELLQRESQQLQHHDDNRELQIDVHARMRVAGASKQPECRARTWPNQCGQKFDDRGFGRGSTDGRSSSAEVGPFAINLCL